MCEESPMLGILKADGVMREYSKQAGELVSYKEGVSVYFSCWSREWYIF